MNFTQSIDLICMGRAAVDLYGEQVGASLENTSSFSKYVGGCPANVAIGSARLGLKTAMLSRVGNEAMGRFVRETLIKEHVDVSLLQTDPDRLTGLVLLGVDPPDRFPLIFYRENCADMAINPLGFKHETFANANALLITGTHCSTEEMYAATQEAVKLAKEKGCQVIFDLDYRPVLWGAAGHGRGEERYVPESLAAVRYGSLLPACDVVVGTEEEVLAAGGFENVRKCTNALIVMKRGERGCVAYPKGLDAPVEGKAFKVEVLNVLGAGDAFLSGFLRGYLKGFNLEDSLSLANANGALFVTRHGCSPAMPYWKELQEFIKAPLDLEKAARWHHSMQHWEEADDICMLAFDHRHLFDDEEQGKNFKWLVYQAFKDAASRTTGVRMGLVADDKYAASVLKDAKYYPFLTARCIEESGIEPLEFLDGREAASILRSWPKKHVVKVLCRGEIGTLKVLYDGVRQSGHALLIELIGEEHRVVEWIEACYRVGVFPNWWKIPAIKEDALWHRIEALISQYDPLCLGVLLLGGNEPLNKLTARFKKIRRSYPIAKGFAVGRSLWLDAWKAWKEGLLSDEQAITNIRDKFITLVEEWKAINQEMDDDSGYSYDGQYAKKEVGHAYGSASRYFVSGKAKDGII